MSGADGTRYVTLAYGDAPAVYRQASMLLLSLLAHAPAPRELVVVTDQPERFDWFDGTVRTHPVMPEQLRVWQGPQPFSMRVKLEAARAAAPQAGSLILLDADTIAAADLSPLVSGLLSGSVFMHTREFELGRSRRRGNRALWNELRGRTFDGWQFRPEDAMWNSGVVGLPSAHLTLIDRALGLYDAVGAAGIRHFATEQLVVGLVLGRTGRLREASRWITHYWGNKARFDREIAARLDAARRGGLGPLAAAERLRADPIDLPAEARPGKLGKLRRWLVRRGHRRG